MFTLSITITAVENGWIVTLPFVEKTKPNDNFLAMAEAQAKILKREFKKDDTIEDICHHAESDKFEKIDTFLDNFTKNPEKEKTPLIYADDLRLKNQFVFKTYVEAIEFLSKVITEEPAPPVL